MLPGDFRVGGLYRLARPDAISRATIRGGHGYLWVGVTRRNQGGNFKSVATGVRRYFNHYEMDPVEKEG